MKNIYILTQALEAFYALKVLYVLVYIASFHVLQVLHVLMYIDSLYAFQVLHVLVYIDSLHVFVYISLPLLRHSMYSSRLLKSALYHVFIQFGRRSIITPIDSAQSMYSFFRARVLFIYSSSSMFAFKNLFHAYLAFFEFFAATRFICVCPIAQGSAPPIDVNIICKHFVAFHRCASRTWQCNIRITRIVCKTRRTRYKRKPEKKELKHAKQS